MNNNRSNGRNPSSRDDRLRAALRANLGRRKAQARARADQDGERDEREPEAGATSETEKDE